MLKTRVDFVCNAGDADADADAMAGVIHCSMGMAWAVCRPLLLVPPPNALCYHSTSSLFSLKLLLIFHTIIQISY